MALLSKNLWHRRLGHTAFNKLNDVRNTCENVNFKNDNEIKICDTCIEAKNQENRLMRVKLEHVDY